MYESSGLGEYLGELDACCGACALGEACESHGLGLFVPTSDEDVTFVDPDTASTSGGIGHALLDAGIRAFQSADPVTGVIDFAAQAAAFIPGIGPIASGALMIGSQLMGSFSKWLQIGAGRREADLITKGPQGNLQDKVFNRIVEISKVGLSPTVTVPQLQAFVQELRQIRSVWLTFLSNTSQFKDGRASTQAADSIMPYLDGTCGYHWPPPLRPDFSSGCGTAHSTPFGNAWPDDFGYGAGLLGALTRGIVDRGGQIPIPMLTQGYGGVPSLGFNVQGLPLIPQAGWIPPVVTPNTIRPASMLPTGSALPLAIGGLMLLLLGKRSFSS